MSFVKTDTVTVTTTAGGAATGYSSVLTGWVAGIKASGTLDTATTDLTITVEGTGQNLWTESNVDVSAGVFRSPTQATHSQLGVATGDLTGIFISNDRIKYVVAQGGNALVGTFVATVV